MRFLAISSLLLTVTLSVSAQFKVNSDGKVIMHRATVDTLSDVSIGESSLIEDYSADKKALRIHKYLPQSGNCYGIYSEALKTSNKDGDAVGVFGIGSGCNSNYMNYGVVGTIPIAARGAGICGTDEAAYLPAFYAVGSYAGYFYGETYLDGYVTAAMGIYDYSDMRLKDNVISLKSKGEGRILADLQKLDVIEYNLKRPQAKRDSLSRKDRTDNRRHYGVSAQELQTIYPDLVREGQDGYLTINYTELVPILIRSIQELKAELDEVKGKNDDTMKSRAASFEDEETTAVGDANNIPAMATLAQNTPNPFSERTTIRFTLPENAHNAFIYIFDMSGKMQKQIPVTPDMQSITIEGYELRAGMYIYSLVIGGKEVQTRRMILSK